MTTHQVHSSFTGGMEFNSSIDDHQILTDTKDADGGKNAGPGPKRLMLVSLAACTGIDIVSILGKKRVSFSDFSIDVEAVLGDEYPKKYVEVTVHYNIKLAEEDKTKMERAVELSSEKYCGVMAMFKSFAKVNLIINYL
jgi:putative redox protein